MLPSKSMSYLLVLCHHLDNVTVWFVRFIQHTNSSLCSTNTKEIEHAKMDMGKKYFKSLGFPM